MRQHRVSSLAELVESFFRQRLLAQRRASPATIATYRDALKLLFVFTGEHLGKPVSRLTIDDLDREVVLAFLDHLEMVRGNSVRTRNARLAAIRSFFQHVAYSEPMAMGIAQRILAIGGKRAMRPAIKYLSQPQLDILLATPDRTTPHGRRDHALLLLLARTGARVSEAIGVNASDLWTKRPWQLLLRGKGSRERIVPLREETANVLQRLCDERGLPAEANVPLFTNASGKRLTRFVVIHILRRTVEEATRREPDFGRKSVTPHTLRHSAAMHMVQHGVDLATIQAWLGHASVNTTHHYVEADLLMKRRALDKCPVTETPPVPYEPTDALLALLERL